MKHKTISKKKQIKIDSAQVAINYINNYGLRLIPLKAKSKEPFLDEWGKLRITEEQVHEYFKPGHNVGALWGEPSNWVIDLDLDCDEAVQFAKRELPETFTYGRVTRPFSHYLFCVRYAPSSKHTFQLSKAEEKDGLQGTILEVRSTGLQSVLPPSTHPDGDLYCTHRTQDFTKLSLKDLQNHVNRIVVGSIFLRRYPGPGERHDFVHAFTGAMLHTEWSYEETLSLMMNCLDCLQQKPTDRAKTIQTIENTIHNHKKSNKIRGFKWIEHEDWLPEKELKRLKKSWGMGGL